MASAIALAARAVLAAALAWAAITKVRDRRSVPDQMRALGVARALTRPLAVLLPAVEAALAVALVSFPSSWWPAWASVVLVAAFTLVVVATVGRGAPCPCFGVSTAPTGPRAIVRNVVLLAVGVLATGPVEGAEAGPALAWIAVLGAVVAVSIVGSGRMRPG